MRHVRSFGMSLRTSPELERAATSWWADWGRWLGMLPVVLGPERAR